MRPGRKDKIWKEERKEFFSEEKNQKTFANSGIGAAGEGSDSIKQKRLAATASERHLR